MSCPCRCHGQVSGFASCDVGPSDGGCRANGTHDAPAERAPKLLAAADLWRWCDRLTKPVTHRLLRESGAVEHVTVPCMLDQLEADLAYSGTGSTGRSKPGSRPPLNANILSLMGAMSAVLIDALVSDNLGKRATLALSLRAVVAHVASTETPDAVDWWARLIRGWFGEVQACLPGEAEGDSQVPIRGMCCPTCGTWTIERVQAGETFRDPAIVLVLAARMVRYAICRACGESWFRGEPLWVLARSADGKSDPRVA